MRHESGTATRARRSLRRGVRLAARVGFASGLAAVAVVTLLPPGNVPPTALSDKLEHALAYAFLAVPGRLAFRPAIAAGVVLAGLPLYGGALELAQWAMGLGRTAEFWDAAASGVGAWSGFLACSLAWRIGATVAR